MWRLMHVRFIVVVTVICCGAIVFSEAATSFCDTTDGWSLSWEDNFEGDRLDPESWNIVDGDSTGSCRDAYCTPNNVHVQYGVLVLTSKKEHFRGFNYTTGAVNTSKKRRWTYSPKFRLCVSAILPGGKGAKGQGIWPAHWMMPDTNACDPDQGEMDILEEISGQGVGYGTYHWETTYPKKNCSYPVGHERQYGTRHLPSDWNSNFHEYAVEHGETYVAYVYDKTVILNATKGSSPPPLFWPQPFYLILNTAVGGSWPGSPNASTVWPAHHVIDFVRVTTKH